MKRIIATILSLMITSYVLADHHEETDKGKIKSAYSAYVDDFMVGDFKAIANKFTYPATFRIKLLSFIPLSLTLDNQDEMIEQYKSLKADVQEGYSYSIIDRITVEKIEEGYVADVIYSRFNAKDELLITGRGLYYYKDVNGSWKMYSVEPVDY